MSSSSVCKVKTQNGISSSARKDVLPASFQSLNFFFFNKLFIFPNVMNVVLYYYNIIGWKYQMVCHKSIIIIWLFITKNILLISNDMFVNLTEKTGYRYPSMPSKTTIIRGTSLHFLEGYYFVGYGCLRRLSHLRRLKLTCIWAFSTVYHESKM